MSENIVSEIDISTATSQNVVTDPAILVSVRVTTALSAHAVTINDGSGGTNVGTLAASAAINDRIPFDDAKLENGINLGCNAAGTGKVIVTWRRQPRN